MRRFRHDPADARSLSDDKVWSIVGDADHHLWIGTEGGGVNEFDGRAFTRHLQPRQDANSPEVAPGVPAVLSDRSGIIWAGTGGVGLYKLLPPLKEFARDAHSDKDPGSVSGGNVWSLLEDREGYLWAGTIGAGLSRRDPATGRFTRMRLGPAAPAGRPESIFSVVELSTGDLVIAADTDGLFRFDRARSRIEPFPAAPAVRTQLAQARVMSVWVDADDTLWLGTLGHALLRLDGRTGALTTFAADPKKPGALGSNTILTIRRTRDGVLWLGTQGDGLVRYADGTFTHMRADAGNPNTLGDDRVGALYEDAAGALWIGTWGGGLDRLSPDRKTFTAFTQRDGLPNDTVYGILDDGAGHLWLSTNRGVCRFAVATHTVRAYTTSEGLLDREYNQGAYHRGRSGRLYFGGVNGITSFDPGRVRDNRHAPRVVITSLSHPGAPTIDGQQLLPARPLVLRHDENSVSIEFAAIEFTAPEANLLQHRLDGLDDEWTRPSTRAFASYTKLAPGTYTFRMRGANSDGVWSEAESALQIVVRPSIWANRWAYALYTALVAGGLVLAFTGRARAHRRQLAAQQAEIERERSASDTLRQAEQALRASEGRFRNFMDGLPGIAFIKDLDSRVVYVNRTFEEVLGFTNDQIAGKRDDEYFPPEVAARFTEADRRVISEQREIESVDEVPFPAGPRYFQTTKFPIVDEGGRVALVGGVAIDITDKKQLEQQVIQTQKLESIGTLAGGIAHDFNNLLTIIAGYTSLLRDGPADDAESGRCMAAIDQAVQRGATLVGQILTFARKSDASLGPVDLNALVRELADMMRQAFPKTIAIELRLHEPLPAVCADQSQVHQALMNLSVNARDAMPEGGTLTFATAVVEAGQLRGRVADADDRAYVCVAVSDTGVGMDEYARGRAFEPFFTTKGPGGGTGLGLAVVYGVAHAHHGFVDLDSEPGRGTTFRLCLPASGETVEARPKPAEAEVRPAAGRATVLVVEDEPLVRDLLTRVLRREGFEVVVAQDGEEAVTVFRQRHAEIGVVLMDHGLPKLEGAQAFEQMKQIDQTARVIIASGNLDGAIRDRLEAEGLCGFLQKPYSVHAVVQTVRRILAKP